MKWGTGLVLQLESQLERGRLHLRVWYWMYS